MALGPQGGLLLQPWGPLGPQGRFIIATLGGPLGPRPKGLGLQGPMGPQGPGSPRHNTAQGYQAPTPGSLGKPPWPRERTPGSHGNAPQDPMGTPHGPPGLISYQFK